MELGLKRPPPADTLAFRTDQYARAYFAPRFDPRARAHMLNMDIEVARASGVEENITRAVFVGKLKS
jgi:hypothetical protein